MRLYQFQELLTFRPYAEKDLKRILEVRAGHSVIPENVLEMIARKVAQSSGDTRKALGAASEAVANAQRLMDR